MNYDIPSTELEDLLKSKRLKYVSYNSELFEYEDLILREDIASIWKKNRSAFVAKTYWLKPNIPPGSIFTYGSYRDVWVRFNNSRTTTIGNIFKNIDTIRIITRKGDWRGKDIFSCDLDVLWENQWFEFVMDLTDEDWNEIGTKLLKESVPDEKLYTLWENPPLGKTDEEILELLK